MDTGGYYNLEKPIEKIVKSEMVKFTINNLQVTMFNLATMSINLVDSQNLLVDTMFLLLQGEEYKLWLSDEYLLDWVKLQIHNKYNTIL